MSRHFGVQTSPQMWWARTAEPIALHVAPQVFRQGIGRRLLERALEETRGQGFTEVSLCVVEGNDEAIAFYKAMGSCDEKGER